jgi:methionyl-tRNA formyltransferase
MKIVFMGTPDFAVPSFDILLKNGYEIVGVVTATDKWGGRGNKTLLESDVKKYALEKGLKILQPEKLNDEAFLEELRSLGADLQVVVAFRMLPTKVWSMPRLGTMNLHGSLLPKYRGAAPINWAIINGETETGVTTFLLQHEIDTGDILFQAKTPIGEDELVGEVYERLMHIGAELTLKSVQALESGNYQTQPQSDEKATMAPKIFHETCRINFNQPVKKVHDFIRGLSPHPVAWSMVDGEKLKIYRSAKLLESHDKSPGTIDTDGKKYLRIACTDGWLEILDLQADKRKRMDVKSFLNGTVIRNESVDI